MNSIRTELLSLTGLSPAAFGGVESLLPQLTMKQAYGEVYEFFTTSYPLNGFSVARYSIVAASELEKTNVGLHPGCVIAKLGFVSFGRLPNGNIISIDLKGGNVLVISHETIRANEISQGWKPEVGLLPKLPLTRENVIATATERFESLTTFIRHLQTL